MSIFISPNAVGPPFGSVTYEFLGQAAPFLILFSLIFAAFCEYISAIS